MKKIIIVLLMLFFTNKALISQTTTVVFFNSSSLFSSYCGNNTRISIVGSNEFQNLVLSKSGEIMNQSGCFKNKIILKESSVDMFKKFVSRYFEWYNKAEELNVNLNKKMYSSENNSLFSVKCKYNSGLNNNSKDCECHANINGYEYDKNIGYKIVVNEYETCDLFEVIYEDNKLVFTVKTSCHQNYFDKTKGVKTKIISIYFSYDDLVIIKKNIDNGKYEKALSKVKKSGSNWEEFESF